MKPHGDEIGVAFFISHYMGIEKFSYSMGAAYMAAYLKEKGIPSLSMSGCSKDLIAFLEDIKKRGARVLGIPAYDILFSHVGAIAREARRIIPDILIVAGGPTATFGDDIILNNIPEVDVAVRREGEETIYDLYRYAEGKMNLEDIGNLSFREGKKIIRTFDRPLIGTGKEKSAGLDVLPSPYATGILTGLEATPGLMTSRGCVFPCTFCCGPAMYGRRVRYHSIERIMDDLKIIYENTKSRYDLPRIDIWDDNFCLDRDRTRRLCEAIIKEGLNFYIHAGVRADLLDRDMLAIMREAGVRGLNLGLESAVPKVLRNIKKVGGTSKDLREEKRYIESIKNTVGYCKELDITPTLNIIFGSPGETYEDGLATLKMIEEMNLETYFYSYLKVFVGTEIRENHKDFGMKVWHGDRILPLKHTPPYDVTKIPVMPHTSPTDQGQFFIQSFENVLFEWWDMIQPFFKVFKPHFIFEDRHDIDDELMDWLKRNLSFFSQLIFRYERDRLPPREMKNIKRRLRREILSRPAMVLQKSFANLSRGIDHYRLKSDVYDATPLYCPADYYSVPFHQALKNRRKSSGDRVVFYNIATREDAEFFLEEMQRPPVDGGSSIISGMIDNEILLSTACRFLGRACPARSLQKIHVRKNGVITTCEHGEAIGGIGDSLEYIKERIEKIADDMEKKRGCSQCSAREYCTRCIFTEPFKAGEYCDFVREAKWLPRMLQFLLMCHNRRLKEQFFSYTRPGKTGMPSLKEKER
ncbi:MAG: B12-binding domain-containing radical SAM protein [Chloroflexi bacterium]|nr:B12-binding domain-containing radical SAM protein [Chloroflexota bacterium]